MFLLHDNTRRTICRALFLGLCIVPTIAVVTWSVTFTLPGRQSGLQDDLSRTTGMRVRLGAVAHPTPELTRLSDVQITTAETDRPVLAARQIEAAQQGDRQVIILSQPEAHGEELGELWMLLERWFEDRLVVGPSRALLIMNDLTLREGTSPRTFSRVEAHLDLAPTGPEATIKFRLTESAADLPATVRVRRDRSQVPHRTRVEFDTGGAPLPCSMLFAAMGIENYLGNQSEFTGQLWLSRAGYGLKAEPWQVESMAGRLTQVDLRRLVAEQFPHHLTGQVTVQIDDARFGAGRLQFAQGRIVGGPGQVHTTLLSSAQAAMQMQHNLPSTVPGIMEYQQLAFSFQLQNEQLQIRGECEGAAGYVMVSPDLAVQEPTAAQPQPILALVRMLVPQSQFAVPATQEADWLTTFLPIPSAIAPANAQPRATKLRVGSLSAP
jgi:hypothetical protein